MSERDFVREWHADVARLRGTYDPAQEHDACGVGLVAALDGKPRREVVQAGIDALRAVWHRGAVDADGKTGDGAGIHVEIPQDFFAEAIRLGGHEPGEGRVAVGMVFMPKTDLGAQERCRTIVETEILEKRPVKPTAETLAKALQAEDVAEVILSVAKLPARATIPEVHVVPTVL